MPKPLTEKELLLAQLVNELRSKGHRASYTYAEEKPPVRESFIVSVDGEIFSSCDIHELRFRLEPFLESRSLKLPSSDNPLGGLSEPFEITAVKHLELSWNADETFNCRFWFKKHN
jgi:hypothetical protein